jgi:hypothetical protein
VTVVVVDVKEHVAPPGEERSVTRELPAVAPPRGSAGQTSPTKARKGKARGVSAPPAVATRRKRRPGRLGALGKVVRGLAAVLVVVVALTPVYLWGGSRYYFGFEDGEVVAYRGLPYAPLGVELNEEWRRTGVEESDVKGPYRDPIDDHKLYTREQAERVLGDLGN